MRFKSFNITAKLIIPVLAAIVGINSALIAYTTVSGRNHAIMLAKDHALAEADDDSQAVQAHIDTILNITRTLADVFSAVKDPKSIMNAGREPIKVMLKRILLSNPSFHAVYTIWEPNAFDKMDEAFSNTDANDATGRFIPCWTRDGNGRAVLEAARDYESTAKGGYYQTAKTTRKDVITDPYPYIVNGRQMFLVSLVSPIIFENHFYGVVAVDITLNPFKTMLEGFNQSSDLKADMKAQINIVSNNGTLAAASGQPLLAGKRFEDAYPALKDALPGIQTGKEQIRSSGGNVVIFSPVQLTGTQTPWAINTILPFDAVSSQASRIMWMEIGISVILTVIAILIIAFVIHWRIRPLRQIAAAAEKIALGNLNYATITTDNDEIGRLNTSFKNIVLFLQEICERCNALAFGDFSRMIILRSDDDMLGKSINVIFENIRKIVTQLNRIAKGGYSVHFRPYSDKDQLGIALSEMIGSLRKMTEENERQNILKTGQMELNDAMRGEQDLTSISRNVITYLCRYLKAPVGALYITDEEDGALLLSGSFAYQKRKSVSNRFVPGEGLIGQAALEKQRIQVSEIPEDYIRVQSGLGFAGPRHIVVSPLLIENTVKGVIEIASFEDFSDVHLLFLDQVSGSIAVAIHSAQARTRMQNLLNQTQKQAEQLQHQQEALRQSNLELEHQATALKQSESRLQTQQEELRQTNEELQEQTQLLEEQKEDIHKKNLELEMAGKLIEEKVSALERASRYKSEFLANMSHELRTPLNSILLLSRLIADNRDSNLTAKQIEFAQTIHESGSDLLNLINEVLDLSKVEAGKMELHLQEVPFTDLTAAMQRNFQHSAQTKGLEFAVSIDDNLPAAIITDQQRIEQIIKNFLSNAFKFTSRGRISFTIQRPDAALSLTRKNLSPETAIAFSVSDTGIGIPKDKQALVFEAFKQADGTTSRKYGGTGLGLSISVELARYLGGEIHLRSQEGSGSTFTLVLPEKPDRLLRKDIQPSEKKAAGAETSTSEIPQEDQCQIPSSVDALKDDRRNITSDDQTLLIIEDDPHFAKFLSDVCHDKGFKVLLSNNGETGLHFADYYKPRAIILDVDLPGLDGWTVLDRLKENPATRHIPVQFISAMDGSLKALKMGAIGFMTKPVSMENLETVFQQIQRVVSTSVRHLLIVESERTLTDMTTSLTAKEDTRITAVRTAPEAVHVLADSPCDVLVLGAETPDDTLREILEWVRNHRPGRHVPVLLYTGTEPTPELKHLYEEYSADIVLRRATSPEALGCLLAVFLHCKPSAPPSTAGDKTPETVFDRNSVFKNKKILLVDDDMRNVYAITNILEEKGMKMVVGKNGREGLERLHKEPDIDLVLMDIMMPVMDGYAAMKEIRKEPRFEKLPIIALTAKAMKGDRVLCIEAGANDYLAKPFDMEKLLSMLRVWLY
jgi:signal transduction histidine kinase/DNA-binding response OmpR family regulator/HAMP domain-containing protein